MKFSLFVIAALAAPATASRKRKTQKKGGSTSGSAHGATGPTCGDVIPIGDPCEICADDNGYLKDNCASPPGLDHGVCFPSSYCQNGQPGAYCAVTSDCVVPPGLEHPVCRQQNKLNYPTCQSGKSGALCGNNSDCVIPKGLDHAVCRRDKCQS